MQAQTTHCNSITLGPLSFEHASLTDSEAILLELLNDQQRPTTLIGFINPHVFNLACQQAEVATFISQCKLCCIDGIGVQIAALVVRRQAAARIVAEDLFNAMLRSTAFRVDAVLIGVTVDELAAATTAINKTSRSINIIDSIDGFQSQENYAEWLSDHQNTGLILIGAGTPRSEQIAMIAYQQCDQAMIWHIGAGTIKTWAGTKRRAPDWISRFGVQWLHRVWFEPHTRSRYFSGAPRFVKNLFKSSPSVRKSANKGTAS